MRVLWYLIVGVVLFYIDSIIGLVIPMHFGHFEFNLIPHLMLLYILLLTIYRGFGLGLIFAVLFGIVTDVYTGSVYGLYMFGYLALVVIFDKFLNVFYRDYTMVFALSIASIIVFEIYIAMIYGVIGFVNIDIINLILLRLIPTIIMNILLLIILFPIFMKLIKKHKIKIDT